MHPKCNNPAHGPLNVREKCSDSLLHVILLWRTDDYYYYNYYGGRNNMTRNYSSKWLSRGEKLFSRMLRHLVFSQVEEQKATAAINGSNKP